MTRDDAISLLKRIAVLSPGMPMSDSTPAAWWDLLRDVPMPDAVAAVRAHYAASHNWITPSDIRKRVLRPRGLLPPDAETAYEQATRMNRWLDCRIGPEPQIHPAAIAAARAMGWDTFDAGPEPVIHRRFVESYAPKAADAAERALATPLGRLADEIAAPKALPAGAGVEAARQVAEQGDPAGESRAEELRRRTSAGLSRLDEAIAALGGDGQYLLPPGVRLESEFGQAALRHKLRDYGARTDVDGAMRRARQEIASHGTSQGAANFEAQRAAQLRALEAWMEAGNAG
jgi:hypothetical protein